MRLHHDSSDGHFPLTELLARRGLAIEPSPPDAPDTDRAATRDGDTSLAAHLVATGRVDEQALLACLQAEFRLPVVDPSTMAVEPAVLRLVPSRLARRHCLVPVALNGQRLTVAVADPTHLAALDEVRFASSRDVRVALASVSSILAALDRYYGPAECDAALSEFRSGEPDPARALPPSPAVDAGADDAPVVRLVHGLLATAVRRGASDIHVEPLDRAFRVRVRCDGAMQEILRPPPALHPAVVSRLKVMARMDIAERRLPQDGRLPFALADGRRVDFRVSSMPTLFGETLVLRLLDRDRLPLDLSRLGLSPEDLAGIRGALSRPNGMILVTGPTGSGKTTTLYAALSELDTGALNICTAEDPVEFSLEGVNQVQIHEEIGLTFAHALRAFLRQDPDVLFVGEIRDPETAEIAVKAALTGHLVLSSLHTNDAIAAVDRLRQLGVAPYLLAATLSLLVAQRLVRRLCERCRIADTLPPESLGELGVPANRIARFSSFRPAGCAHCGGTGYRGRVALYEVVPVADDLRQLIVAGAAGTDLKRAAVRLGARSLRDSGLAALAAGLTTAAEVSRATPGDKCGT